MKPTHTILVTLAIASMASNSFAQWQLDGNPACTAVNEQNYPAIVADGSGGAIIVWEDHRNGNTDVYAQRFNAAGTALWASDGVALCTAAGNQGVVAVTSDGAGGAIAAWWDERAGSGNDDIYAQSINASGAVAWAADGVAVCAATGRQLDPRIIADGAGGAIVTWSDRRGPNADIYAQRINASGAMQWAPNGAVVCGASNHQTYPFITADGVGGAFVAWVDARGGVDFDIYAQRIDSAGAAVWTADGVVVCNPPDYQFIGLNPIAATAGGVVVVWQDYSDGDMFAQKLNLSGARLWATSGVPVAAGTTLISDLQIPTVVTDGDGGALVAWPDARSGNLDVYVQRIASAGTLAWTPGGVPVSVAPGDQGYDGVSIVPDETGGAFLAWDDSRSGAFDIYAQHVNAVGALLWIPNGVALCAASNQQLNPCLASNPGGQVIVAWQDHRDANADIYATPLPTPGQLLSYVVTSTADDNSIGTLRRAIIDANASPGTQGVRFNIPGAGIHTIQVLSALPAITDSLVIDGFTQPGASPNTNPVGSPCNAQIKIEINGGFTGDGFKFQAPGTLRGIASLQFHGRDVVVLSDPVVIEGNYFGIRADGTYDVLNAVGIWIQANNCRVGGSTPASRNVITEGLNITVGIQIAGAWYAKIVGNYIGVMPDLSNASGNEVGVLIEGGARSNTVGLAETSSPQEANIIGYNLTGVSIVGIGTIDNGAFGNLFRDNGIAIDLGGDGRTANDAGDGDDGPNHLQNFPDISAASGTQISGMMHGQPNQSVILNFYRNSGTSDAWLGWQIVNLDGSGDAPFTFAPAQPIPPSYVAATAREFFGSTSELSDWLLGANTPTGSNVLVNLVDSNGVPRGTATFAGVDAGGNTGVTHPFTPPVPLPGTFSVGNPNDPANYFDISTYAGYQGGVDICLFYDENNIPGPEANLVLAHYNGTTWEDVTTTRDAANNKICGHVMTLSPFAIATLTPTAVNDEPIPNRFALHGNVPNPFNPVTTIGYDVPRGGAVNITVYDVSGRLVRTLVNEHRAPGAWSVSWNGEDDRGIRVASGVYFYRMRAGDFVETRKMVLLK